MPHQPMTILPSRPARPQALDFDPSGDAPASPGGHPQASFGSVPRPEAPEPPPPAPALLYDLATAGSLLLGDLLQERMLDAYLRAAGMAQITDDYLHAEIYPLDRAAGEIDRHLPVLGRLAAP